MQKTCTRCGASKPLDAFYTSKRVRDGRTARCRACCNAASAESRAKRPEAYQNRVASWKAQNAERVAEYQRQWKLRNRDRVREYGLRRRAAGEGRAAAVLDLRKLWEGCAGLCGLCGTPIDRKLQWPDRMSPSVDHIQPLSKGGTHTQANVQWTHLVCNMRKGDRPGVRNALAAVVPISQEDTDE